MRAQRSAIPRPRLDLIERPAQRLYILAVEKNPGAAVDNRVERTTGAQRHHRRAGGHRLQRRNPKIFDAWQDQTPRARERLDDSRPLYGAQKLDVGWCATFELLQQRTAADDHEALAALDREIDPLVGHER